MPELYSCDACGKRRLCCRSVNNPHGEGSFCHTCRQEADEDCDECKDVSIVAYVRSSSSEGHYYAITDNGAGQLFCPCKGFGFRQKCQHVDLVHFKRKVTEGTTLSQADGEKLNRVELVPPREPAKVLPIKGAHNEGLRQYVDEILNGGRQVVVAVDKNNPHRVGSIAWHHHEIDRYVNEHPFPARADEGILRFDLVVAGQRIEGSDIPFSALQIGDLQAINETADRLSRLLGVAARIVTGGEEPEDIG